MPKYIIDQTKLVQWLYDTAEPYNEDQWEHKFKDIQRKEANRAFISTARTFCKYMSGEWEPADIDEAFNTYSGETYEDYMVHGRNEFNKRTDALTAASVKVGKS